MNKLQTLQLEQSENRQGINALLAQDTLEETERTTLDTLTGRAQEIEVELRAAIVVDAAEQDATKAAFEAVDTGVTPEQRERLELRSKARLSNFIGAALRGRAVLGAEAELMAAAGVDDGIPFECFEPKPEQRAVTPAPGTVGINLDPLQPAIFAPSIAAYLNIEMPQVPSGTYATGTVSTSVAASALAKGTGEALQDAGAITVGSTGPKRVAASMALTIEDIAAIGADNFESTMRDNIAMVLSAELDNQFINGAGAGADLNGIFERLTNPNAPAAAVETWTRYLAIQSGGIDGLWATELEHIALMVGVDSYRLAAATFQGNDSEESAASYLKRMGAGFQTNSRMPAKVSHIQQGILCRKGRPGLRTAVSPTWGSVSIDDIYSGARTGQRAFTVSALVGDVLLVQPDAYAQVAFRVST